MNTIFMTHSFEAFESLLPADASDSRFLDTILPTIISAADDIRAAQKIVLDASQSSSAILLEEISRFLKTNEFLQDVNLPKIARERSARPDYWSSEWGKLLLDKRVYNLKSLAARRFKRRFRVNIYMYEQIKEKCIEKNIFEEDSDGCPHGNCIPIDFKILVCLRKLGRCEAYDTSTELCYVAESTCAHLFKMFVRNFCKHFYEEYVNVPEGDELLEIMEKFREVGLSGHHLCYYPDQY